MQIISTKIASVFRFFFLTWLCQNLTWVSSQPLSMVDHIFWTGVDILKLSANWLGITYQELNVYFFIFFHPFTTLLFLTLWLRARRRNWMFRASVFAQAFEPAWAYLQVWCKGKLSIALRVFWKKVKKIEQVSGYDVGQCSIDEPVKLYSTPTTELHRPRIWINFAWLR